MEGEGTVTLSSKNGTVIKLNALYIPNLTANLISVGQMIAHKLQVSFSRSGCNVMDQNKSTVLTAKCENGI